MGNLEERILGNNFENSNIGINEVLEETAKLEERLRDFAIFWQEFEEIMEKKNITYPPLIKNCPFIRELLDKLLPQFLYEAYQENTDISLTLEWKERVELVMEKIEKNPRDLSRWTRDNMMKKDSSGLGRKEFMFGLGVSKEVLVMAGKKYNE